jgi:hypothetical protein
MNARYSPAVQVVVIQLGERLITRRSLTVEEGERERREAAENGLVLRQAQQIS